MNLTTFLTLSCIIIYGITQFNAIRLLRQPVRATHQLNVRYTMLPFAFAVSVHAFLLFMLLNQQGFNLNLHNTLLIIGFTCAFLTLSLQTIKINLGLIWVVSAFATLSLVACLFLPASFHKPLSPALSLHAGLSLSAYAILGISSCQALITGYAHMRLHQKKSLHIIQKLPAITDMEQMLFYAIGLGFVLLTLSLITGFIGLENMFTQHVAHKTVFSLISWFIFFVVLIYRYRYGLRGKKAIQWTLIAFTLLCIAFLGTQFIKEILL